MLTYELQIPMPTTHPMRRPATIVPPFLAEAEVGWSRSAAQGRGEPPDPIIVPRRIYGGRTYVDYCLTSPFMGVGMYFMLSNLVGIVASVMTVTRGGIKEEMLKEVATGTVAVKTSRSTSLLSVGMGSDQTLTHLVKIECSLTRGGGA